MTCCATCTGCWHRGLPTRRRKAVGGASSRPCCCSGLPLLVICYSEGTYYAAQLAAADQRVVGIVLIAGPVRTGGEVLSGQTEQLASMASAAFKGDLEAMSTGAVRLQRKNLNRILASSADVPRIQGTKVNARWIKDFVAHGPAPVLERVTAPALAWYAHHPPRDIIEPVYLPSGTFWKPTVSPSAVGVRTTNVPSPIVVSTVTSSKACDKGPLGCRDRRRCNRRKWQ